MTLFKKSLAFFPQFIVGLSLFAQTSTVHPCITFSMQDEWLQQHPELKAEAQAATEALELFTQEFIQNAERSSSSQYIIPVVFHVIHNNGPENISKAQILDCLRILNIDYNKQNADTADIIPQFAGIIGNPSIEFRLAKVDPFGNPTDGIERIQSQETFVGDNGSKLNPWPRANYLNVWVTDVITSGSGNSAAAYSQLPGSVNGGQGALIDGIITNHRYVGSIGTAFTSGSSSRTLTHETGHYLNLPHTWGFTNEPGLAANCSDDDGVGDTPNTIGTFSCNLAQTSCGSLDNVQNYMDYACEQMFTVGQANRMHAALNSSTAQRSILWSTSNLIGTGVTLLSVADFTAPRRSICQGESILFSDASQYDASDWNWSFAGGTPLTSTVENPVVQYQSPGLYNVGLEVKKGSTTLSANKNDYLLVAPMIGSYLPISYDFEASTFPNADFIGNNSDEDDYYFQYTNAAGYSGTSSIKLNNYGNSFSTTDEILSSSFDLSPMSATIISFRVAYAQRTSSDGEVLRIYVSNDCGATWKQQFITGGASMASAPVQIGSEFTPSGQTQWKQFTTNTISADYRVEDFMFKFTFQSNNGNNLYIDDINISGTYSPIPVLESPLDGQNGVDANALLNWKATDNVQSYEYQLDVNSNFNSTALVSGTKAWLGIDPKNSDTEFLASGLANGQTYFWRVRAIQNGGPTAWSDTWSFTISPSGVGREELSSKENMLALFPNPSTGLVTVNLKSDSYAAGMLIVSDVTGRSMYVQNITVDGINNSVHELDLSNLSTGVYFVSFVANNSAVKFVEKLMIDKK